MKNNVSVDFLDRVENLLKKEINKKVESYNNVAGVALVDYEKMKLDLVKEIFGDIRRYKDDYGFLELMEKNIDKDPIELEEFLSNKIGDK